MCDKLHVATGGKVEETKTTCHAWKWKWKQGQKVVENADKKLNLNRERLKQTNVKESAKTLGLHIAPTLK